MKNQWVMDNFDGALALEAFVRNYRAKYPKAVAKLEKDRMELLAFYDYPAEHWRHIRTTNAIESTFATVRHRTSRTKNCVSRNSFIGLGFKMLQLRIPGHRGHPFRLIVGSDSD